MIPIEHKHISSATSKNILRQNTQLYVQKTHSILYVRKKNIFLHIATYHKRIIQSGQKYIPLEYRNQMYI